MREHADDICDEIEADALMCKRCRKASAHCTCMDKEAIAAGACQRVPMEIRPGQLIAGRIRAPVVIRISDMDSFKKRVALIAWLQEVIFTRLPPDE